MRRSPLRGLLLGAGAALLLSAAPAAEARSRGIAVDSCAGCHGNGDAAAPQLSMRAEPAEFEPGDSVTFTLEIRAPSIAAGGAFITNGTAGSLRAAQGSGLTTLGQGLGQSSAKAAVAGVVSFSFSWQAPSTPGALQIGVAALAANGNGTSGGDSPGSGQFQWVYGCEGVTSFVDFDRDGYGTKAFGTRLHCKGQPPPDGFAELDGDCDENDEKAHPGATEVCNKRDDNCDGQVDEGATPVEMWPDEDGDGFYTAQTGPGKVGCGNLPGYAATGGDCDDLDPKISPKAEEICNSKDDDCDGDVDERVRPQCGLGWCSRYSTTCNPEDCVPGPPREETCNAFDDDCDGELDNGVCTAPPCAGAECGGQGPSAPTGGASAGQAPGTGGAGTGSGAGGGPPTEAREGKSGCAFDPGGLRSSGWLALVLLVGVSVRRRRGRTSAADVGGPSGRLLRPARIPR
jgi:Putative metal-binding motif